MPFPRPDLYPRELTLMAYIHFPGSQVIWLATGLGIGRRLEGGNEKEARVFSPFLMWADFPAVAMSVASVPARQATVQLPQAMLAPECQ